MKLATVRTSSGTAAVRMDADAAVDLGTPDLGALLARPEWKAVAQAADGPRHDLAGLDYAPPRTHILEMGRELPEHPTLFAKVARAMVGAYDPVELPAGSEQVDWEAEPGVVIGAEVRHATPDQAAAAIAGYTVVNDVTARDFQYRSVRWLQGKTFERSTPVGPWLVVDEGEPGEISCEVDGDVVQKADTADLDFDPVSLVGYLSQLITLVPGDLIATFTPGGVGHARKPPRYLAEEQRNTIVTGA